MNALSPEALIGVTIGIGLAAAAGFRVFLPLLVAALASRWGGLPLADGFQWLSSASVLVGLVTASVLEIAAYYVPGVDHVLDVLSTPVAVVAGAIASASVMTEVPPAILWPVAIIGGGGIAGLTKVTAALVRAKTGLLTGGLGNPVVSAGETATALGIALAAIVIPVVCLIGLVVLFVGIGRWTWRKTARGPN